ncbi:unnamed protein product [Boreogadus saida]
MLLLRSRDSPPALGQSQPAGGPPRALSKEGFPARVDIPQPISSQSKGVPSLGSLTVYSGVSSMRDSLGFPMRAPG